MKSLSYIGYAMILAGAVGVAFWYADARDLRGRYEKQEQREELLRQRQHQVQSLEQTREETEEELKRFEEDAFQQEEAVRTIKGMVRDGETVYILEPATASVEGPVAEQGAGETSCE